MMKSLKLFAKNSYLIIQKVWISKGIELRAWSKSRLLYEDQVFFCIIFVRKILDGMLRQSLGLQLVLKRIYSIYWRSEKTELRDELGVRCFCWKLNFRPQILLPTQASGKEKALVSDFRCAGFFFVEEAEYNSEGETATYVAIQITRSNKINIVDKRTARGTP